MLALALLLSMTLQQPIGPGGAYADSATASLVHAARAAREQNERRISHYRARVSQRLGMGLHTMARDRMLFRQELVADIDWRRDSTSTVTVRGARQGVPIAVAGDQLPDDLASDVRDLVIDPAGDELRVFGNTDDRHGFMLPLAAGAESLYTYRKDRTTTIGLPGGRSIALVALAVTARRADYRLVNGTFWFDSASSRLVRAVFRPARPFNMRRDLTDEDLADVPAMLNVSAEVRYLTLEYALQDDRWWLPRLVAIDAVGRVGRWLDTPFRLERRYDDWQVTAAPPPAASGHSPGDSVTVIVPADTVALLTTPLLGPPILQIGDLLNTADLAPLTSATADLPQRPWELSVTPPDRPAALFSHLRYNRVEGLSLGLAADVDFGKLQLHSLARIGLADGAPGATLTLERHSPTRRLTLSGFHRLETATPDNHPFGLVNSVMALVAGRDDGEYYRSTGVAITVENSVTHRWRARLWHAEERPVTVETAVSLPHLFDGDHHFRPNLPAARASETGALLTWHADRALSGNLHLGADASLDAATGDYDFGRGAIALRATLTPTSRFSAAVTLAAGTSRGPVPLQHQYFLGGSGTLRGYAGAAMRGESYWLGRLDIGRGSPAFRFMTFADVGWAGPRSDFGSGAPLIGAGVGASILDGMVRVDLARALRAPTGWRVEFYFDGLL